MKIDDYLQRIGHTGTPGQGRSELDALLLAHLRSIPFENLDVILGRTIELDPDALMAKLVERRRGGYCFEHGLLFAEVLRTMGHQVDLLGARVRLRSQPGDPPTPRTHLALRVQLNGESFLVDPGFGGPGPQFALPLDKGPEHEGPGGRFRFSDAPMNQWALQRRAGEAFVDVYHLGLEPIAPVDVAVANHFVATHPASPFTRMLWVRTLGSEGSKSLVDAELAVNAGGERQVRQLSSRRELVATLETEFGLRVPELAEAAEIPGYQAPE